VSSPAPATKISSLLVPVRVLNAKDFSGISVSDAGDVNGDGLDDLIVGAHQDNLFGKGNAGKSYVIFGKTDVPRADRLSAVLSFLPKMT
jgi:hypothetical protein